MVVRQMVDGTSALARAAADTVVGVGDGVMGGVVGAFTGAVQGASEGLGVRGGVSPSTAMVASGVTAGLLGLVDWPLLALAGGTALLVRQLNSSSTAARRGQSASRAGAPAAFETSLRVEAPSAAVAGGGAAKNGTVQARVARGSAAKKSATRSRRSTTKKSSASTTGS